MVYEEKANKMPSQGGAEQEFVEQHNYLRGGSQFEEFEHPYYVGLCHSTIHIDGETDRVDHIPNYKQGEEPNTRHRIFLVVLRADAAKGDFAIVYVGGVLPVHHGDITAVEDNDAEQGVNGAKRTKKRLLRLSSKTKHHMERGIDHDVGGLAWADKSRDTAFVAVDLRFMRSTLISIKGIRAVMKTVMAADIATGKIGLNIRTQYSRQVQLFVRKRLLRWWFHDDHGQDPIIT